jgi:hypothetical protein
MSREKGKKPHKRKGLTPVQKSSDKAHRILARSHISHGRLMKIIDAYTRWETVGIAAKESRVSRITVGKIYNLIRQRLLDFGMYESDETYRNRRYDMENDEEEGQRWYDEDAYRAKLAHALGRFRGIDPAHFHLFEAEAVFRVNHPMATQGDLKTLIMEAIKKGGPLNETPRPDRIFETYMERVAYPYLDKALAAALKLFRQAELNGPVEPVGPDIDVAAIHRRWAIRDLERSASNDNKSDHEG